MTHLASPSFWDTYDSLPGPVQRIANHNFQALKKDPKHPSLHFKKIGRYWSVRVEIRYRALAVEVENDLLWFWIGSHVGVMPVFACFMSNLGIDFTHA
jgi:hypothetical protein